MLLRMTLLHLKTMLKKTPVQLLLIVLTQVFAAVCILLAYGVSQNIFRKQEKETEFNNRWFEVSLTAWQEMDDGKFMPVSPLSISETNAMLEEFLPEIEDILSYYFVTGMVSAEGGSYSICGTDLPNAADNSEDPPFSYSDYKEGNHVVQVSYRDYPCSVGDEIRIGTEPYKVMKTDEASAVGLYAYTFYMPYRAFPQAAEITSVNFVLLDAPTEEQAEAIAALIQQYFGMEAQVTLPIIPDLAEQQFNRLAMLICAVIAFLVILNVSMVYLYTLRQRQQMLGIYCLCGCTPNMALSMFAWEWLLVLSLCYGGAYLAFRALLPRLELLLNGLESFYSPMVYPAVYGLYLLFSLCLLILGSSSLIQQDTAKLVKEVG